MDTFELKKEQQKLAPKVMLSDSFSKVRIIAGAACIPVNNKLLAAVVVLKFPSLEVIEKKTFLLDHPLPYKPGFLAYREMPAIVEAYNQLEEEPDLILVNGPGILHPRKLGIASHLGLALNIASVGVSSKLLLGKVEAGKILVDGEFLGFEVKTKEHANPLYVSPGYKVSLGSALKVVQTSIRPPHKLPEPLHIAQRIVKKKAKEMKQ